MTRRWSGAAVVVVALAVVLAPLAAAVPAAAAPPSPPASYYGDVAVNGEPAPAGVEVSAVVNGSVAATLATDADGSFGDSGAFAEKLVVNASAGQTVTLRVGSEPVRNVTWESGDLRELSLSVRDDEAPSAAISAPDRVPAGTTVELDASASTDDVAVAAYEWTLAGGETASGETTTVTFDSPGQRTVDLVVEDAAGNTDTATTTITVTGAGDGAPGDGDPGAGEPDDGEPGDDPGPPADTPGDGDAPGDGKPGAPADPPADGEAPAAVVVTPDEVNVSLTDVQPGQTVNVTLPDAGPANGSGVSVTGLSVETAAAVTADLGVSVGDEPGADVPPPGGDADEAASDTVAYVTVAEDVDESALESVEFEFTLPASTLAERGATPSEVSLWRRHDGEWNALETRVAGETETGYQFVADSPGLSVFAVRAGPADVEVTAASLDETAVEVGESVTVSATVTNDGPSNGTATVPVVVGDRQVAERSVTVPPGDEQTVTATFTPASAGEFDVAAGAVSAGTLSVSEGAAATTAAPGDGPPADAGDPPADGEDPPVEEPAGFSPLTVGVLAVVLGAMLALFLLARRRA